MTVKEGVKKYWFLVILVLIIIMIPVIILLIKRPQKITNFYENDPALIHKIIITNGNNGEIREITEEEQIVKVTQYLSRLKINKRIFHSKSNGWSYRFNILFKNENPSVEIVFAGKNSELNQKGYIISGPQPKELLDELKIQSPYHE